jgi:primosomal protein N' (replication factor Y)
VLDPDVAEPEPTRTPMRDVAAVVSAGPPGDVVDLCRWAAWRWAGPLATFLRAASPPNVVDPAEQPERETAVYPPSPTGGAPLHLVSPGGDDETVEQVWALVASEGSTIVVDPRGERLAKLAARLAADGRVVARTGSGTAPAHATAAWARARRGACVVVGGRSAVWAPVPDLGAIVVLDDADEALEEERAPTWNARDVALERARRASAAIEFVSPAPTADALVALDVSTATGRVRWPRVVVVDLRDEEPGHGLLTAALADALRRAADEDRRAICVGNRRGRARLLACRTCGELARCEHCGATVGEHERELVCARCGTARPLVCLHCGGARLRAVRPGVVGIGDELRALLPRVSIGVVDAATSEVPDAGVLVGTEALLHRVAATPPVGVVAFLELDQELLAPRIRAAEQALWLLVRGARVIGPARERAQLLVQTRVPDHVVVRAVVGGRPLDAALADRETRRALGFPPFGGLAAVSGEAAAVSAACAALRDVPTITVLGPVAHDTRALVRAHSVANLCDALARPDVDGARREGRLRVDVDPRRV